MHFLLVPNLSVIDFLQNNLGVWRENRISGNITILYTSYSKIAAFTILKKSFS